MSKKIFLFLLGIFIAINLILLGITLVKKHQTNANTARQIVNKLQSPTQSPSYTVENKATAPQSSGAMAHGEITRESENANPSIQRFTITSSLDDSVREIFTVNAIDLTFEKITDQNWSPTNKFLYVYIDYANRRDVLFIKTDGRFTNGNYYLHSTGLYPTINVQNATWIDDQTLELQSKDTQTNRLQKYRVSFDDDTGIVTPELNN